MQELQDKEPDLLEAVVDSIESEDNQALTQTLEDLQPGDIAHVLESLPPSEREPVWECLEPETRGEVLVELRDEVRETVIEQMSTRELMQAIEDLDAGELAYILDSMPEQAVPAILASLDHLDRARLEQTLSYPEDTAGRLMDSELISVRPNVTVDVVLRYLRRHEEIPPHTDSLMVVDKSNAFIGTLPLARLLTAQVDVSVGQLTDTEADRVKVDTPAEDVAALFERHDLVSLAVVDDHNKLLGRITVNEIVDFIHEEADQTLLNMAGLDQDDDLFAPVLPSARRRAVWLGINLGTAFLAAYVIGLFEATLQQVVALAVLMPIVASMGGIAGSQTLTLAIRGLALQQISATNARWLALKELAVGALNGLIWAVVVGVLAIVWFGDWRIGAIIAAAMMLNLLAAAAAGIAVPLLLDRLDLDPALSGSVILTTVTDVVGFMSFLGLGTLFLL